MCMDRTKNNTLIHLVLTPQKPKAFASWPQTQRNSPGCPGTKAAASLPISKDGPQFPDTRCSQLLEHLALEEAYIKRVSKQVRERTAEKAHDRGNLMLSKFTTPQYSDGAFIGAFRRGVQRTLWKCYKMRRYILGSRGNRTALFPMCFSILASSQFPSTDTEVKTLTGLGYFSVPDG